MADEPTEKTQKTQPKKGDPIVIPIPTESQIERDFTKIALASEGENSYTELSNEELCARIREAMPGAATEPLKPTKDIEASHVADLSALMREMNRRGINCLG